MAGIRLAQPADCAAVTACVRLAYTRYVAQIGREPAPMGADYAELIAHGAVYVIATATGAGVHGVLVLKRQDHTLWIENVAVHPDHQHHGLGRALLAFAEQHARTAALSELRLYTHELMVENIALYQRLGYIEVDRREDEGFRRVFMRKPVA
jgi:ribosomal protein S18 acetylase RimI-like enzyme